MLRRSSFGRPATVLVCGVLSSAAPSARAADTASPALPLQVTVQAPESCLEGGDFLARVKAQGAGVRPPRPGEAAAAMEVLIEGSAGQVTGKLVFRPVEGPLEGRELLRELHGATCAAVAGGLAFVAAIVLEEASAPSPARPPPPPTPPPAPNASASPRSAPLPRTTAQPPEAPARAPPSAPLELSAGVAMEVAAGLGPDPAVVPRLFAAIRLPGPLARIGARASIGRSLARSIETGAGSAEISLTDVRFEPCLEVCCSTAWRVDACALVEAGVLEGSGATASGGVGGSGSRALTELGVGIRPTWTIARVTLGAMAGGALPLARYRFYFSSPDTTVYAVPAWSALAEVSAGVRFW